MPITFVLSSITVPTAVLAAFAVCNSFQKVSASTPTPPHFSNENLLLRALIATAAVTGIMGEPSLEFDRLVEADVAEAASDP